MFNAVYSIVKIEDFSGCSIFSSNLPDSLQECRNVFGIDNHTTLSVRG